MRFLRPQTTSSGERESGVQSQHPATADGGKTQTRGAPAVRGLRLWQLIALLSTLAVALGLSVYLLLKPEPPAMTREQFDTAVEVYLQKRPPDPTAANVAYAVIYKSLVQIRAFEVKNGKETPVSLGTGFIAEETGSIMTALHVVSGGDKIMVTFFDGFETEAELAGAQPQNDIAILKPNVVPDDALPATFASSSAINIGDEVVAVGNPFGISGSVSSGVVSGLGRTMTEPESNVELKNLIQFDAAVNPGNSGGPLLDRNGEVVGVVTALLNPTRENFFIGIGFAVTIETAGGALGIPPW